MSDRPTERWSSEQIAGLLFGQARTEKSLFDPHVVQATI